MLITLLLLYASFFVYSSDNRIAFIFAGTYRSFPHPVVHGSIRNNLITSFCPLTSCIPDIFMRISMTDNVPLGASSVGVLTGGKLGQLQNLKRAVQSFYGLRNDSFIRVEWVDIGSSVERAQMASEFPSFRHKIYRLLDPRRYSMYFNRYRSYKMMLERERSLLQHYRWVVHVRLDAAFGEPLRPYYFWPYSKVWVPDSWWCPVPDTFALIPRGRADDFFSIDNLVSPGVMCLGGPNFGVETVTTPYLRKLGFNENEIPRIHDELCTVAHPKAPILKESGDRNDSWSTAGFSETIFGRKMDFAGVSQNRASLGYVQIFMVIVRAPINPLCFYSHPVHKFGAILRNHPATFAMHSGCLSNFLESTAHLAVSPCVDTKTMNSLVDKIHNSTPISQPGGAYRLQKHSLCTSAHVVESSMWNFMPLQVRSYDTRCVTVDKKSFKLFLSPCISVQPKLLVYSSWQLFSLHLISTYRQQIRHADEDGNVRCLTASTGLEAYFTSCEKLSRRSFQRMELQFKYSKQEISLPVVGIVYSDGSSRSIYAEYVRTSDVSNFTLVWKQNNTAFCLCPSTGASTEGSNYTPLVFLPCAEVLNTNASVAIAGNYADDKCRYRTRRTVTSGPEKYLDNGHD